MGGKSSDDRDDSDFNDDRDDSDFDIGRGEIVKDDDDDERDDCDFSSEGSDDIERAPDQEIEGDFSDIQNLKSQAESEESFNPLDFMNQQANDENKSQLRGNMNRNDGDQVMSERDHDKAFMDDGEDNNRASNSELDRDQSNEIILDKFQLVGKDLKIKPDFNDDPDVQRLQEMVSGGRASGPSEFYDKRGQQNKQKGDSIMPQVKGDNGDSMNFGESSKFFKSGDQKDATQLLQDLINMDEIQVKIKDKSQKDQDDLQEVQQIVAENQADHNTDVKQDENKQVGNIEQNDSAKENKIESLQGKNQKNIKKENSKNKNACCAGCIIF
ncbi:UNKNOWN [Stylonychia lemnae]|uniref:Uncharacterized protein n=1 Tax=Stylonychia lemnae TaxID=5949 RepID=A0A078AYQ6_STYLE|nr:UNKNOWN [Stylonychia lemnae]|eukprot:CDW85898.1 UNKNOWN [Stylonychia lemnae]